MNSKKLPEGVVYDKISTYLESENIQLRVENNQLKIELANSTQSEEQIEKDTIHEIYKNRKSIISKIKKLKGR
ncbi:hypothetical protein [Halarcobacter anaerophilus]|uniref:hypothetical protein n=1 Tax=Halarcobacter anaerophilus TaxID=877500 RepID=UPI0005C9672B|nr:hypothetical protein [Halarcobacter anaerophilus]